MPRPPVYLVAANPGVAKEFDVDLNAPLGVDRITTTHRDPIWWRCSKDPRHVWQAVVRNRHYGLSGCPACSGHLVIQGVNDLATTDPAVADLWDYERNGDLTPEQVTRGSQKRVHWRCSAGHASTTTVANRASGGFGCPTCSGRDVLAGFNDFASQHPEAALDWDYERNGDLTPDRVSAGSNRTAHWRCHTCSYRWETVISARRINGCRGCAGRVVVPGVNDLATTDPAVADLWDYERNGDLTPEQATRGSTSSAWFYCSNGLEHSWEARISAVAAQGQRCAVCRGAQVWRGFNDLATTDPAVADLWDYERNGNLTPEQVTRHSNIRVWWRCSAGHSWDIAPTNRIRSAIEGCRACYSETFVSVAEREVHAVVRTLLPDVAVNTGDWSLGRELDIVVPSLKVAIEFNGLYWHSEATGKTRDYHQAKSQAARAAGLHLIHVWEDDWMERRDIVVRGLAHRLGATRRLGGSGVLADADPAVWEPLNARALAPQVLEPDVASAFLDANHIQGAARATVHFGLCDASGSARAVLSVMRGKSGEWTIERFASRGVVRGGFTRLLAFAEREVPSRGEELLRWATFADEALSQAGLYSDNGFTFERRLDPDYRYLVGGRRVHKFNYRLKRFRADPALEFIEGATERELADLNGLVRIWDCGKSRWVRPVTASSRERSRQP